METTHIIERKAGSDKALYLEYPAFRLIDTASPVDLPLDPSGNPDASASDNAVTESVPLRDVLVGKVSCCGEIPSHFSGNCTFLRLPRLRNKLEQERRDNLDS